MLKPIAGAWALFLGIGLLMLGNGLQGSLLGLRAVIEGFPTAVTGLIMSSYYAGFLVGSTLAPRIVERVGHIRVFAALATLASAAVLLHTLFIDPYTWIGLRLMTGFCYAGLYVVAESWVNDQATNETRGAFLSIYMVVMLGGMAGGQFLLNVADPGGFTLFILISVLISCALVPIALTTGPVPNFDAPAKLSLRALAKLSPLGVFGTLGTGVAHGALFGMGAVFAGRAGLPLSQIALFMAALFLGGTVMQWPIGWISDRFDRRRVLTVVTLGAGIVAFGASAVPLGAGSGASGILAIPPHWLLFGLAALFGGLSLPLYSLCSAHTNDYLDPGQMVAASGSLVFITGVGAILGPLGVSAAMSWAGPAGFFWFVGVVHGLIGIFAVYRMSRRAATPLEDQGSYVAIAARASPVAAAESAQIAVEEAEQAEQKSN